MTAKNLFEKKLATDLWFKVLTHHRVKIRDTKAKARVVLVFLLVPVLASRLRFYFAALVGLTIGLAIGRTVSMGENVVIGLLKFSWRNLLSSFQKWFIIKADFQVFSSLG